MLKRLFQLGIIGFLAMAVGVAHGQVVYDRSCNNGGGSSTSTLSCTISSVTAGALLMIGDSDSTSNTRTVTVDGTAATLITTQSWAAAGLSGNIYYFANAGAGTHTVTVTYSAPVGYPTMIVNAFNNAPTSGTIIDVSSSLASTPASTINCGNLVTTGANEVQWAFGVVAAGITVVPGTGYSAVNGFTSNVQSEFAAATTAGTYSPYFTGAASNPSVCLTAAINAAVTTAANPTFSPAAGTYGPAQTVTLATATSGATIVYTTDGSTPTATGGTATHGTTYSTPFSVSVTSTVKAIASKSGIVNSPVSSATYTIAGMRTWYVRPSGGTIYSVNNTSGQCDGVGDTDYSGSGINQHCAAVDLQALWINGGIWVIAGGDVVIVRQNTAPGYRNGPTNAAGTTPIYCNTVGNQNCYMPSVPAGSTGNPTQILGENYASCVADSSKTNMFGGFGVKWIFNLGSTHDVTVQCFNLTDNANCDHGSGGTMACNEYPAYSDYAQEAIYSDNLNHDIMIQDVFIHSFASRGALGSTGPRFNVTRFHIRGAPITGWDFDIGVSNRSSGAANFTDTIQEFAGCLEDKVTGLIEDCTDDQIGGQGDGFGFPDINDPTFVFTCTRCIFAYNTQDGSDARHVFGQSKVNYYQTIAYGNMGNQIKSGAPGTLFSNIAVGNCFAMKNVSGAPFATGATSRLSSFCRGNGAAFFYLNDDTYTAPIFAGNTALCANGLSGSGGICVEVDVLTSCTTCAFVAKDNVFLVYPNNPANGDPSGAGGLGVTFVLVGTAGMFGHSGSSYDHNATYAPQTGTPLCPNTTFSETNGLCTTPGLTDQTWPVTGYRVLTPASGGSSVVGSGVAVPSLTLDFAGLTRPNPPSRGAYEFSNAVYMYHAPPMSPMR